MNILSRKRLAEGGTTIHRLSLHQGSRDRADDVLDPSEIARVSPRPTNRARLVRVTRRVQARMAAATRSGNASPLDAASTPAAIPPAAWPVDQPTFAKLIATAWWAEVCSVASERSATKGVTHRPEPAEAPTAGHKRKVTSVLLPRPQRLRRRERLRACRGAVGPLGQPSRQQAEPRHHRRQRCRCMQGR